MSALKSRVLLLSAAAGVFGVLCFMPEPEANFCHEDCQPSVVGGWVVPVTEGVGGVLR